MRACVQRFRGDVGAIWPNDRADLRIDRDLLEELGVPERFEDRTFE